MKRLLILTFYFPPDLCAGSFRMDALIKALKAEVPKGAEIDVLTTLPNRYHEFNQDALPYEKQGPIHIHRFKLPAHKSGFLDQSKAFISYALQVFKHTKNEHYDLVFATSSRLFTAALGAYISRKQKCKLYLDIRDIFTDTMDSLLTFPMRQLCLPFFKLVERYTLAKASHLNVLSEGFLPYFQNKIPKNCQTSFIPNGIDKCFLNYDFTNTANRNIKRVLYAGNIGQGQALEKIIPTLAKMTKGKLEFHIIGAGGRIQALKDACYGLSNVSILPPIRREELLVAYKEADILFLHLNDVPAFEKVLPSKLFEYGATGKPILAGVNGYAENFCNSHLAQASFFKPCDAEDALKSLSTIVIDKKYANSTFCHDFKRSKLASELAASQLA